VVVSLTSRESLITLMHFPFGEITDCFAPGLVTDISVNRKSCLLLDLVNLVGDKTLCSLSLLALSLFFYPKQLLLLYNLMVVGLIPTNLLKHC
jgi:hypothetical protein